MTRSVHYDHKDRAMDITESSNRPQAQETAAFGATKLKYSAKEHVWGIASLALSGSRAREEEGEERMKRNERGFGYGKR
ncbi:hypothetical protein Baya_6149 [Bagarius yarrelli]|uniref:Uncharacterized protein n=1 Tax=Bagarius yarrelli TaxID=175774 RepID=A0A556U551_BAGYA|nr:hypothetical protein Baya_6149 [Bagarius yarrelli]